jgi:UDP-glucose 4-epimerase
LPAIQHSALKWISGNYADEELLRSSISQCRTIIHAASDTTPGISAKTPVGEVFGNFHPTLELIQILQEFPDRHLIYLSSGGAIYGNPNILPANEISPCKPISYYGAGKLAVETFFQVMNRQCGCPVTILRPSNFYGPGQKPETGFGLIFHLLHRAKTGQAIEIWGDGSTIRDFLYIHDFVEACMNIISSGLKKNMVKIYNVGSEVGYSINEVVDTVEKVIGIGLEKKYLPARPVDVKEIVLDCTLLKKELHWLPVTDLREGIAKTWEWLNS